MYLVRKIPSSYIFIELSFRIIFFGKLLKKLKKLFYNEVDDKELGVTKLKLLNTNHGK